MENEIELKMKYNELLDSLTKGANFLAANPDKAEEAQKRIDEIQQEMNDILEQLPNTTTEEINEGFKIEQVSEQAKNIESQNQIQIVQKNNIVENYSNKWKLAEKLSKSSIIPKEFQGKPENILLCMGMSEKMGLDLITVVNNLQMVMRTSRMERQFHTSID